MAADVLMGNDRDAARWIRAHRDSAQSAAAAQAVPAPAATLSVLEGGAGEARPAGNRPRINRRALAAASAMRDAAGGGSGSRS
jgi:hypothetical protein